MKFRIAIIFLLCANSLFGQVKLSDGSKVYLITFGPSQAEVYAAFGHSAVRVSDQENGFDIVYNYGAFDFEQENFYLNFALGKPYYSLAIGGYERTEAFYTYNNQSITQQELNLTLQQRQSLFDFLEWNAQPENKSYLYDYFYDNCSTRIPDAFYRALGDVIFLDTVSYYTEDHSFREMVDYYTPQQPWGDLGIDICLGLEIDQPIRKKDYLFLPDYLYEAVDKGTIYHGDSLVPLVKRRFVTNEERPMPSQASPIGPKSVFWLICLLTVVFTFFEIIKRRHFKIVDSILLGSVWLMGIFLLVLWFATEHKSAWNFNLLWANPFHGIFLFLMIKNRKPKLVVYHFLGYGILLILTLIFWQVLPQPINPNLLPLVIALALRSLWIYRVTTSTKSWIKE